MQKYISTLTNIVLINNQQANQSAAQAAEMLGIAKFGSYIPNKAHTPETRWTHFGCHCRP